MQAVEAGRGSEARAAYASAVGPWERALHRERAIWEKERQALRWQTAAVRTQHTLMMRLQAE